MVTESDYTSSSCQFFEIVNKTGSLWWGFTPPPTHSLFALLWLSSGSGCIFIIKWQSVPAHAALALPEISAFNQVVQAEQVNIKHSLLTYSHSRRSDWSLSNCPLLHLMRWTQRSGNNTTCFVDGAFDFYWVSRENRIMSCWIINTTGGVWS